MGWGEEQVVQRKDDSVSLAALRRSPLGVRRWEPFPKETPKPEKIRRPPIKRKVFTLISASPREVPPAGVEGTVEQELGIQPSLLEQFERVREAQKRKEADVIQTEHLRTRLIEEQAKRETAEALERAQQAMAEVQWQLQEAQVKAARALVNAEAARMMAEEKATTKAASRAGPHAPHPTLDIFSSVLRGLTGPREHSPTAAEEEAPREPAAPAGASSAEVVAELSDAATGAAKRNTPSEGRNSDNSFILSNRSARNADTMGSARPRAPLTAVKEWAQGLLGASQPQRDYATVVV